MPRIVDAYFGDDFGQARDQLATIAKPLILSATALFKEAGDALDRQYTAVASRERLLRRQREHQARALGQPTLPDAPRRGTTSDPSALSPAVPWPNAGDELRAPRLGHALEDFVAANQPGELLRNLGPGLPRLDREANARRAILLCLCVLDPDAPEYLDEFTDLARGAWVGRHRDEPPILGRADVLRLWKAETLGLLSEAIAVLRPPAASADPAEPGHLWVDEDGCLNQSGYVPLSQYIEATKKQLRLFLSRLEACERTAAGGYAPRDAHAGRLDGLRVLYNNVQMLASSVFGKLAQRPFTAEEQSEWEAKGVVLRQNAPPRNATPLADVMRQLMLAIVYNGDGTWAAEIPAATVEKLRAILNDLDLFKEWVLANETKHPVRTPMAPTRDSPPAGSDSQTIPHERRFTLEHETVEIVFEDERVSLTADTGFRYIARLLAEPNPPRPITAAELEGRGSQSGQNLGRDAANDERAKEQYGDKLIEYAHDIATAQRAGRDGEAAELIRERAELLRRIQKDTGLGGQDRLLGSDEDQRAFDRVRKAISRALKDLRGKDAPRCIEHLDRCLKLRRADRPFQYCPDDTGPGWQVSGHI